MTIYLDNSATTRPYKEVTERMAEVMGETYGNPSSLHRLGLEAEKTVKQSREILAESLGVKPEEVAYFGDSSVDMETAKNAGAIALGVTWGFRTREELEESGARFILEMPADLFTKVEFVTGSEASEEV